MEKIALGIAMASDWTSPTAVLVLGIGGGLIFHLLVAPVLLFYSPVLVVAILVAEVVWWNFVYHKSEPGSSSKYLTFADKGLEATYANAKIPMCALYEAFIEGKVAFKGDVYEVLAKHRDEFVNYKMTARLVFWLIAQLVPATSSSFKNKKATKKEIAEHYDRGNDFFEAFLGPRMVYTSGVFRGLHQNLEEAQDNKMDMLCDKVQLKKGETLLDIGCGWGTLIRHAALRYGAKATGVTLSAEGAKWCRDKNKEDKVEKMCEVLQCDYRDIPEDRKFDKVTSIEMAEHVGLANFQLYLKNIGRLMKDDGIFLMQVAGLRQGADWQDVAWGLFMSKYIFPGADASTPLNWYVRQAELAGFEVHSVETIGRHYSHTLLYWYRNWMRNREAMTTAYDARLFRLWEIFLSWSTIASGQGSATCYQIALHKNTKTFPRDRWCTPGEVGVGSPQKSDDVVNGKLPKPHDFCH